MLLLQFKMTDAKLHEGKMQRGAMWYSQRGIDGELPDGIKNDPYKMCDVDYFLENSKPVEKKKKGE